MKMDICDWLREYLRYGPKEVSEIRDAARKTGYSKSELRKATLLHKCHKQLERRTQPDRQMVLVFTGLKIHGGGVSAGLLPAVLTLPNTL